jgi:DNA-directed RNA polymerase subunit RPC12/RpoP
MYHTRHYHCLACKKDFTLSDGIIEHLPTGVECPHCGSLMTIERSFGAKGPFST